MAEMIFLNSGGLDSLATAIILTEQGHTLRSLFLNIGQPNTVPAQAAAQKIADRYCVDHVALEVFGANPITREKKEGTAVPFLSNFVMLVGAMYASSKGIGYVVTGGNIASAEFNDAFMAFCRAGTITPLVVPIRPMSDKNSDEIYPLIENDPLLKETYSCRVYPKCGGCGKCLIRKEKGID